MSNKRGVRCFCDVDSGAENLFLQSRRSVREAVIRRQPCRGARNPSGALITAILNAKGAEEELEAAELTGNASKMHQACDRADADGVEPSWVAWVRKKASCLDALDAASEAFDHRVVERACDAAEGDGLYLRRVARLKAELKLSAAEASGDPRRMSDTCAEARSVGINQLWVAWVQKKACLLEKFLTAETTLDWQFLEQMACTLQGWSDCGNVQGQLSKQF